MVMFISSMSTLLINYILVDLSLEFLRLISYIAVIASAVKLVEIVMKNLA